MTSRNRAIQIDIYVLLSACRLCLNSRRYDRSVSLGDKFARLPKQLLGHKLSGGSGSRWQS